MLKKIRKNSPLLDNIIVFLKIVYSIDEKALLITLLAFAAGDSSFYNYKHKLVTMTTIILPVCFLTIFRATPDKSKEYLRLA